MDPQARFEAIFTAHYRDIHRFALRRTDPAEAEEVANEAFAICWAKLAAVPEGDPQPACLQALGQVDEHRFAVIRNVLVRVPCCGIRQHLGQRDGAVLHPALVDVVGFASKLSQAFFPWLELGVTVTQTIDHLLQFDQAPDADAGPVVPPAVVQRVGSQLRRVGMDAGRRAVDRLGHHLRGGGRRRGGSGGSRGSGAAPGGAKPELPPRVAGEVSRRGRTRAPSTSGRCARAGRAASPPPRSSRSRRNRPTLRAAS